MENGVFTGEVINSWLANGVADYKSSSMLCRALEDPGCYGDRERISMFRAKLSFLVKDYDDLKGENA